MKTSSFIQNYLSLVIKLILVLSIFNAVYNQLWHIMSTNIFLLILMFLPQIVEKYEVKIPRTFEWALFIFVILTLFLGKAGGIVAPIFFGVAVAFIGLLILAILYSSNQIKKNYFLITLFSFNFAVAFGAVLELLKFFLKKIAGHTLTGELYAYTMRNLLFVIIGAAIAAIIGLIYMKGHIGIRKITKAFLKLNPKFLKKTDEEEISEIISKGEDERLEFKSTLRTNLHTNEFDKKIEYSVLKTIVAFLNFNGGTLLIGISNKGEILGINADKFEDKDKFSLHLTNIIKEKIGKKHLHLINLQVMHIKDKAIMKVKCKKASKEVFLKPTPKEEEFYTRVGPSNSQLVGSELIEYVDKKFKKRK